MTFFRSHPYDKASVNEINIEYGFEIKYFKEYLNYHNVVLTKEGISYVFL